MISRRSSIPWSTAASTNSLVWVPRKIWTTTATNKANNTLRIDVGRTCVLLSFLARIASNNSTIATEPIMWIVIWFGTKFPSTTSFPNHASNPSKNSTPKESTAFHTFFRTWTKARSVIRSIGSPDNAPMSRLINSIQVCTGLNMVYSWRSNSVQFSWLKTASVTRSDLATQKRSSRSIICPSSKVLPSRQVNVSTSVGGILYPKHCGQSGHPIPEPVALTTDPARMTKKMKTRETVASFLKSGLTISFYFFKVAEYKSPPPTAATRAVISDGLTKVES